MQIMCSAYAFRSSVSNLLAWCGQSEAPLFVHGERELSFGALETSISVCVVVTSEW